jgi:hypothetical protein
VLASARRDIISAVFRQITVRNWTERDPTNENFAMPGKLGMRAMTGNDWAGLFLDVELVARVPEPVQSLFLVARNTLLYGHFFYPLYTLGSEQLYRVADAAALHRYRDLGGPKTKRSSDPAFKARIGWLREHGVIADERAPQWEGFRELRNDSSHPDMQSVFTPGNAYTVLRAIAECVCALYAPPALRRRAMSESLSGGDSASKDRR